MNRRNALKVGAIGVAAAAVTTLSACVSDTGTPTTVIPDKIAHHHIVIIGGGIGGMTVANTIKGQNKNADVLIIEKRDTFMACPVSNTYLGKLEGMDLGTFTFDYAQPMEIYGYDMLTSEVIAIDRILKTITTAAGIVGYDILVLSPGIAYNYKAQFPSWDAAKTKKVRNACPGALIAGSEHIALERQLMNMDDGDVVITVPSGKYRCPPAPFERASMIAAFMEKEQITGKVILLVPDEQFAKKAAFLQSWKDLHPHRIQVMYHTKVEDVDVESKTIYFTQEVPTDKNDEDGDPIMKTVKKSHRYEICNLIPNNMASAVITMAGLKTISGSFHKVKMNGCSFQTATDSDIYAVGDVVGHSIPPSGATAIWAGAQCANEILARLGGKKYILPVKNAPIQGANVCFSMVSDKPEQAIRVYHSFSWNGAVIKGKSSVPKEENGKFYSEDTAKAMHDWYRSITSDLFT